jgi:DNA-binding phage protein
MEVYVTKHLSVARGFIAAREKLGWTHYRLAKESGLPWRTIVRLEQEGTNPTLNTLAAAAAALGFRLRLQAVSEASVLWGDGDPKPAPASPTMELS